MEPECRNPFLSSRTGGRALSALTLIAGGTFSGRARRPRDTAEIERVRKAFCGAVHATDYLTWINWRKALPTHTRIEGLLREWFEEGTPLVIELDVARQRAVQRKRATERASR